MIDEKRIGRLERKLERLRKIATATDNHPDNWDKAYYGNPAETEIMWVIKTIEFEKQGVKVEESNQGLIIEDKFLIAIRRNRWKVIGKNTWYWYKDAEDFVKRYVKAQ